MSIIPNSNNTFDNNLNATWLDNIAMSVLLKKLEKIQHGFLQVYVNDMLYEFGNSNEQAKLHAVIRVNNIKAFQTIIRGGEPAAGWLPGSRRPGPGLGQPHPPILVPGPDQQPTLRGAASLN